MVFSSIEFLFYFLPAVLIVYFLVPRVAKNAVLLVSSLLFYAWGEPKYVFLMIAGALVISMIDDVPGSYSIFETASAVGTVGLTLGITPSLSLVSHLILIVLMFIGRVGGLTLLYAAMNKTGAEVSQYPVEKISVG